KSCEEACVEEEVKIIKASKYAAAQIPKQQTNNHKIAHRKQRWNAVFIRITIMLLLKFLQSVTNENESSIPQKQNRNMD
ncbi:hypothetical protein Tsubulata_010258, partial [Turnera subulata]